MLVHDNHQPAPRIASLPTLRLVLARQRDLFLVPCCWGRSHQSKSRVGELVAVVEAHHRRIQGRE